MYQALYGFQLRVLTGPRSVLLALASVLIEVFRSLVWDLGLRTVVEKLHVSRQDFHNLI